MKKCLTPKKSKNVWPQYSQSSRENTTPSSSTSPLASHREVCSMEKQTVGCSGFSDSLLPGETTACEVKVFQVFCGKVSAQISALNRLKNTLPLRTKESRYRAFILPYFDYCNQVWHHCGKRNTAKIEKVNERALRYILNDTSASYQDLLERIRLPSLETRRIQDMLRDVMLDMHDNKQQYIAQSSTRN